MPTTVGVHLADELGPIGLIIDVGVREPYSRGRINFVPALALRV